MAKLGKQYAKAFLGIAKEHGNLEEIYRKAKKVADGEKFEITDDLPSELRMFLQLLEDKDVMPMVHHFIELVQEELRIVSVEAISAAPLTQEQVAKLEVKLIHLTRKRVEIQQHVDPSLLGGVRIIIDNYVIDNTVKTQLSEIKQELYKGVYFKQ